MQQHYSDFEQEKINFVLRGIEMRQSQRHQETLHHLKQLARLIPVITLQ